MTIYVIVNQKGLVAARKKPPSSLKYDERVVKLKLNVDKSVWVDFLPTAEITVNRPEISMPDVEVLEEGLIEKL